MPGVHAMSRDPLAIQLAALSVERAPARFTAHGKQIKDRGSHMADAVSEDAAATIARALENYFHQTC